MSKKRLKKRKTKNLLRFLFVVLIILVLVGGYLTFLRFDVFGSFGLGNKEPVHFIIPGECYIILDNVFFNLNNGDDCKKECDNECWVRELKYFSSEFINNSSCNSCDCYCE